MTILSNQVEETKTDPKKKKKLQEAAEEGKVGGDGAITAITARDVKKAGAQDINAMLMGGVQEAVQEMDHEVFVGYESGAIGLFKVWLE